MPGFTYSSGNVTYSTTAWTGIWGGSTYVTGGTTLPPQTSTVTPFAYPTTSDTTPDPTLNTVKTTVKSVSNSKSWGPTPTSSHEHTGSICVENCNGGCKLCPPGLNIDIDISGGGGGGGGGGGDDDDDDDNNDRKTTTITESAYTTTMTEDGKLTTITESARTTTETETESSSSTETSITLTAGIAIGTYTAFVESSGSLEATTEPIDSLLSIATILNREFSSLYSAEISSLQAGLYTTTTSTTSTSTTSTTKTSTSTTSTTAAAATPTEELYISLSEDANLLEDQYTWMYFVEKYDASFTVCDGYDTGVTASEDATYPGTISFSNDINGMSDCVYTGTSSGPGTFTCPALGEVVQCLAVETTAKTCYTYLAPIEVTAKILCTW
ncbi:hypothetical protein N7488_012456 [Penicillium malachiteum]|nr:hypothetical protein N7488_012456 [Penicillium malachiteum]